jgi:hypothetical protein
MSLVTLHVLCEASFDNLRFIDTSYLQSSKIYPFLQVEKVNGGWIACLDLCISRQDKECSMWRLVAIVIFCFLLGVIVLWFHIFFERNPECMQRCEHFSSSIKSKLMLLWCSFGFCSALSSNYGTNNVCATMNWKDKNNGYFNIFQKNLTNVLPICKVCC